MSSVPAFEQKKVISLFVIIAYIGLTVAGVWLLYGLRPILPPLVVSAIVAMTLAPEVEKLERAGLFGMKVRRGAAIAIIYLTFLLLCGVVIALIPKISSQMINMITSRIPEWLLQWKQRDMDTRAGNWMAGIHLPPMIRQPIIHQINLVPKLLADGVTWLSGNLPALAANLVWLLVPVLAFFLLLDLNKIIGKLLLLAPEPRRLSILKMLRDIITVFGSWVRGVLSVMAIEIIVIGTVLWSFGMLLQRYHSTASEQDLSEYALTLAVIAGILYTIPYLGAAISTLLIGIVTWMTEGALPALVAVVLMVIIHQVVFDNVIAPRVIGKSVRLHPLLALLSMMAGSTLFGVGGMLLAIPITAAVQVVLVHLFPQFQSDAVAVGEAANVVQQAIATETERTKAMRRNRRSKAAADETKGAAPAAPEESPVATANAEFRAEA